MGKGGKSLAGKKSGNISKKSKKSSLAAGGGAEAKMEVKKDDTLKQAAKMDERKKMEKLERKLARMKAELGDKTSVGGVSEMKRKKSKKFLELENQSATKKVVKKRGGDVPEEQQNLGVGSALTAIDEEESTTAGSSSGKKSKKLDKSEMKSRASKKSKRSIKSGRSLRSTGTTKSQVVRDMNDMVFQQMLEGLEVSTYKSSKGSLKSRRSLRSAASTGSSLAPIMEHGDIGMMAEVPDRQVFGVENFAMPQPASMGRFQGAYIAPPKSKKDVANRFAGGFQTESAFMALSADEMQIQSRYSGLQEKSRELKSQSSSLASSVGSTRASSVDSGADHFEAKWKPDQRKKKGNKQNPYGAQPRYNVAKSKKRDYLHDPTGYDLDSAKTALDQSPVKMQERAIHGEVGGKTRNAGSALTGLARLEAELHEEEERFKIQESRVADDPNAPVKLKSGNRYTLRQILTNFCQECEVVAEMMLLQAIKYPMKMARLLMMRSKMQARLWQFMEDADIEIDYSLEDFTKEMNSLLVIRRRLSNIDRTADQVKEREVDSGDSMGDETMQLNRLKEARKQMRYQQNGDGMIPAG